MTTFQDSRREVAILIIARNIVEGYPPAALRRELADAEQGMSNEECLQFEIDVHHEVERMREEWGK